MSDWADVAGRIDDEDAAGVVEAFNGLTEGQRRELAPAALKRYRDDHLNAFAGLAVLATGTRADADRLWPGVMARQPDACIAVLEERKPGWLDGWVTRLCERDPRSAWPVARGLRLRGLYAGDSHAYSLAIIAGIGTPAWAQRMSIHDILLADRSLLDDELWRAFQIEGGGDTSFAAHDKFLPPALSWSGALQQLAAEGEIDRRRLIDATLDALSRGYSAFRAGWFVRFHDELDPRVEERKARAEQYLELLGSATGQVQSFAVRAAATLDGADPIDEHRLVGALRPAVLNRAKGTASRALRLVDAAADRSESVRGLAALVAADALLHESPEVQAQALEIVERHSGTVGDELASVLASAAPVVAPSLQPRLAALAGGSHERAADAPSDVRRTWPNSILDASVLDALDVVAPVETTAELALSVARALEHTEETDELERALDGISRLSNASRQEAASVWAPLRKRAERHLGDRRPFVGGGVAADFAGVVAARLDRTPPAPTEPRRTVMGFLAARMRGIAERAAGDVERPLLSAPTHCGGWIDPEVLVTRLAAADELDEADLVLALLRLAPDRREKALAAAAELPGDSGAALRYGLGSDGDEPGSADPVWVAAVRARFPGRDAPDLGASFRKLGAGAAVISRPTVGVHEHRGETHVWHHLVVAPDVEGRPPTVLYPTVAAHAAATEKPWIGDWYWWGASGRGTGAEAEADVRWSATLQPGDLDPFFTEGLARIGNNLDWWEARWELRAFLEPLLELRTTVSGIAVRLLALALGAKEPGIRGLAADATCEALVDGRLDASALGASLGEAWASPLVTPRRFALALGAAAASSDEARGPVREALTVGLRSKPHADAAQVLELLNELCHAVGAGVGDHEARSTLSSYTSGKAGRIAKSLLAL